MSTILYLLCSKNWRVACDVEYRYGGRPIVAISRASSTETGSSGLSAGVPYFTWNFPSFVR